MKAMLFKNLINEPISVNIGSSGVTFKSTQKTYEVRALKEKPKDEG